MTPEDWQVFDFLLVLIWFCFLVAWTSECVEERRDAAARRARGDYGRQSLD